MYAPAAKAACLKRPKFCFPVPNPSITARLSVASSPCATLTGSQRGKVPWCCKDCAAVAVPDRGWGKPTQALDANRSFFDSLSD
jgi:hypothetical protein